MSEHPLARKLYREFKAGSKTMTKVEAYGLGNELDRLHGIEQRLLTWSDGDRGRDGAQSRWLLDEIIADIKEARRAPQQG